MPDEFEAEAIARRVREDLEYQRFHAQDRVTQAERDAQTAKDAVQKNREAKQHQQDEAAAAEKRAGGDPELTDTAMLVLGDVTPTGGIGHLEGEGPGDDTISSGRVEELPPPDRDVVDQANAAQRAAGEARAELRRIEEQLANLPSPEDIMSEGVAIDWEWDTSKAATRSEQNKSGWLWDERLPWMFSSLSCRELIGLITAVVGAGLLAFGVPRDLVIGTGSDPGRTPVPTAVGQAPPVPTAPRLTPAPPAAAVTGTALGLVDFERSGGTCPTERFQTGFALQANVGALTMRQLGIDHESTGTIEPNGDFETMGDGQSYRGMIRGSYIGGLYMQPDGCQYRFRGYLDRPMAEGPPYGTAPARLEFYDPQSERGGFGLLDIPVGRGVHVIVGSNGDPDIRRHMPITVRGMLGDQTFWSFAIEGSPAQVCRDATGCSGDAPTPRDASWDDEDLPLTVIATGRDGNVLAVHAPRGMAPTAPTVTPTPAAPMTPAPNVTPAPTAPPPASTTEGGGNLALMALGIVLFFGGLGFGFWPRVFGSGRTATVARDSRLDDAEANEALAAEKEKEANALSAQYDYELAQERAPIDFGEAAKSFGQVASGHPANLGSEAPPEWFESTKADIERLRAEAAQLREEAAKLRAAAGR